MACERSYEDCATRILLDSDHAHLQKHHRQQKFLHLRNAGLDHALSLLRSGELGDHVAQRELTWFGEEVFKTLSHRNMLGITCSHKKTSVKLAS